MAVRQEQPQTKRARGSLRLIAPYIIIKLSRLYAYAFHCCHTLETTLGYTWLVVVTAQQHLLVQSQAAAGHIDL